MVSVSYVLTYQLAFVTPGMFPAEANSLKHKRQIWNLLEYARGLPHNLHLLYFLTLNLGVLFCFAIKHSFAIRVATSLTLLQTACQTVLAAHAILLWILTLCSL